MRRTTACKPCSEAHVERTVFCVPYLDPSPLTCLLALLMPAVMFAMGALARMVATNIVMMTIML